MFKALIFLYDYIYDDHSYWKIKSVDVYMMEYFHFGFLDNSLHGLSKNRVYVPNQPNSWTSIVFE